MKTAGALVLALALAGCAGVPTVPANQLTKADPWENWNRKVFAFNDAVDNAVLKPVAEGYQSAVPQLVRTGVNNFFGNFVDVWSSLNQFMQGKMQLGLEMGMRVVTNTVFGLGGILDPASEMRLAKRSQDFGSTLGHWGLGPGPYMVLPFFGPSDVRDSFGFVADFAAVAPSRFATQTDGKIAIDAFSVVRVRANLLGTTDLIAAAALDRYSFIRDAYLTRRLDIVYDGSPPPPPMDDDGADMPPPK